MQCKSTLAARTCTCAELSFYAPHPVLEGHIFVLAVRTGARRAAGQGRQDKRVSLSRENCCCDLFPTGWHLEGLSCACAGVKRPYKAKPEQTVKQSEVFLSVEKPPGNAQHILAKITAYFRASSWSNKADIVSLNFRLCMLLSARKLRSGPLLGFILLQQDKLSGIHWICLQDFIKLHTTSSSGKMLSTAENLFGGLCELMAGQARSI